MLVPDLLGWDFVFTLVLFVCPVNALVYEVKFGLKIFVASLGMNWMLAVLLCCLYRLL